MLTALNQDSQLINLLTQEVKKSDTFNCPGCRGQVRLKAGKIMRRHFAHVSLKACHYFHENESAQHLELKSSLYSWLQKESQVEMEAHLPELNQIADLLVDGKLALEVQCSPLSITRLQERTQSYHAKDYQVIWLLGRDLWLKDRLTSLQKQFLRFSQNMGFHLWELDLERKLLRLHYLIHEDWHGRVHYLTKSFPFFKGSLVAIFRQPYAKQSLSFFKGQLDQNLNMYIAKQLYYQAPLWMEKQRQAYEKGENLLTKSLDDFYPQIRPPQSNIGFIQIREDVELYQKNFFHYYEKQNNKQEQMVYPPVFYYGNLGD